MQGQRKRLNTYKGMRYYIMDVHITSDGDDVIDKTYTEFAQDKVDAGLALGLQLGRLYGEGWYFEVKSMRCMSLAERVAAYHQFGRDPEE